MPVPNTKILLNSTILAGGGYSFTTNAVGDLAPVNSGVSTPAWVTSIGDLDGDGRADFIFGAPGDDDKAINAGRVFVSLGAPVVGNSGILGTGAAGKISIDGVAAGDRAGAAVGAITDLNGDGRGEILVGAPGMDKAGAADAGAAFVLWGMNVWGGIDLADPFSGAGNGKGYSIKGEAAGDAAGGAILSVGDLNGDGLADVLVGAAGNDAGGIDAGAAYVVWGKANDAAVQLANVAAGVGGFKIAGLSSGSAVGSVLASLGDQNGDGKGEILIGMRNDTAGGANAGAVYVVDGKATGTAVDLASVAAGIGGYKITGVAQDGAGAAVANAGDVNGDGRADILIGAPQSDSAYVVFGQAGHAAVDLANVRAGTGGFRILAEAAGDLNALSVTGGVDLNSDGIQDFVIGAQNNAEGGFNAGAVYVVWGGSSGTVDLAQVALGIGGAKIVGAAGSLTGAAVGITADANGDGVADLIIGAPGVGEGAKVLFTPPSWLPDRTIYGTSGADTMALGYGGAYKIDDLANTIMGLAGDDNIDGAGGNDTIEGGSGNDTLFGGAGNDSLDGGTGVDSMVGGVGDDTYLVDDAADATQEFALGGIDSVVSSVNYSLGAEVEKLFLTGTARVGTGNALDNIIVGTTGADTLDGQAGSDLMNGDRGDDTYIVDDAFDTTVENKLGGVDTVISSIDIALQANIENLILTGAARIGTGNFGHNVITGTAFDDLLNGGTGMDTLVGGAGNDFYVVDDLLDSVVENVGEGTDTVQSYVNHTLGLNVENLVLLGAALVGTGNGLDNDITGNGGANTLDGGLGADTMTGGLGNDTYFVDNAGDVIVEAAGGGIDTVVTTFDYTLSAGEIENLTLSGSAHQATGNAAANTLTGSVGADTLNGGGGTDTLIGGAGNDTYVIDDATDTITELAGGGIDTVLASFSASLAAEVENLTLTTPGSIGTGNLGANILTGTTGNETLIGLDGNDTLDGGTGADTMDGGLGDDTFMVDDIGDVVIEGIGGGIDTIVSSLDILTIANNIENIRLTGAAHTAVGNSGNNTLSGNAGNDNLDGGAGDDLLLSGDGNDSLTSRSGHDTLSGGSGDDVYHVSGGWVEIDDYLGHDTLDGSASVTDDYIDLSGSTDSHIENQVTHITPGGTTAGPLDVQFLQDLSGSFGDDIMMVQGLVPQLVAALRMVQANSMFGVSSFIDKPVAPFGAAGEWVYQQEMALSSDATALAATYGALAIRNGMDGPEAQIEGLMQLALNAAQVGFRPDAARFVVLFTDAPYHLAGDGAAGGILTPNNGDNLFPAGGALEDYPSVAQLQAALQAANIIPIFAIAGGFEATYQSLATMLGRGTVVSLTANSSNIVSAITAGMAAATTTHIEDARGGTGNDVVYGGVEDNHLWGNLGNDTLNGRSGHDILDGEDGNDNLTGGAGDDDLNGGTGIDIATFSGLRSDYSIVATATGHIITDLRVGSADGTDTMTNVEYFAFSDVTVSASGVTNAPPVANADVGTALAEATAIAAGISSSIGNVLTNDTDADLATPGSTEVLTVTQARAGDLAAAGASVAVGIATVIDGIYGALTLNPDGSYSYALDNNRPATQALIAGQTVQEVFTYRIADNAGATAQATLSFDVNGANDIVPVAAIGDVDLAPDAIAENSANGNVIGFTAAGLAAGGGAVPATFALVTDATGATADLTGPFQIDAATGIVTVRNGLLLDFETATSHTIFVQAMSPDGTKVVSAYVVQVLDVFEPVILTRVLTAVANIFTATTNDHYVVSGLAGNDIITTLAGNDTLRGGTGNDNLSSGDGNDTFLVSGTADGFDTISGGIGTDSITALSANTVIGLAAVSGIESISSALGGAIIRGNAAANLLDFSNTTLTGIIRIDGGAGNDTLVGSAGADTILGGLNDDNLSGGAGDDVFQITGNSSGFDIVNGGFGLDRIDAMTAGAIIGLQSISGIEAITGSGLAGAIIRGNGANNLLDFSGSVLTNIARIEGGNGNDTIIGSAGDDTIAGNAGNDLLFGGAGTNTFQFTGTANGFDAISGGAGLDSIVALAANTTIGLASVNGVENISANGFANVIVLGSTANNLMDFSAMSLNGIARIDGNAGNDTILGSAGGDTIAGGAGADVLTGGAGADVFDFNLVTDSRSTTIDRITDFAAGTDLIDLTGIDADTLLVGDQAFSFIGAAAFGLVAGQLRAVDVAASAYTRVLADVDGNGTVDLELRVAWTGGVAPTIDLTSFLL